MLKLLSISLFLTVTYGAGLSSIVFAQTDPPVAATPSAPVTPTGDRSTSTFLLSWHSQDDVALLPGVTYDVNSLNNHFKMTPAQLSKALADGSHDVDKNVSQNKLLEPVKRMPEGVRGSHGKSHESGVWCIDLDGTSFINEGYDASRLYRKPDVPESWMKNGAYAHAVVFSITLTDAPKIGSSVFQRDRGANEDAVVVEKFLLTDDSNNTIESIALKSDSVQAQSGTFRSRDNNKRSAVMPFYQKHYLVQFPLFNFTTGKALVPVGCKSIKLHIITASSEMVAQYDLK